MNPPLMAFIVFGLLTLFAWSARRRWKLMRVGMPTWETRFDRIGERLKAVWRFAFYQEKMRYYFWAGFAHQLIFLGFIVLLLRSIVLWGRGFDPDFNLLLLGPEPTLGLPLGAIYAFLKDTFALLVLLGVAVFFYYRVVRPQQRMALGFEGLVILGIIAVMMVSDIFYDAAAQVLQLKSATLCGGASPADFCDSARTITAPLGEVPSQMSWHLWPEPAASLAATWVEGMSPGALIVLAHAGFWTHATLVLVFLNILPYSKHFHIITAIPNVFFGDLRPRGRLRPLAENTEKLMEYVEKASELDDMSAARIGYSRIEHFTWKDILDFYTCTECGRCSDNCPATMTGKVLSPKHFTLDLRDHLYARQDEFLKLGGAIPRITFGDVGGGASSDADESANDAKKPADTSGDAGTSQRSDAAASSEPTPDEAAEYKPVALVPDVVHEDVLWACTTCRACEQQCPVNITYVDKIVQMRRNLVVIRGEFPAELNKPFEGMEVNGNPWNLSRMDRANWTDGLEVPRFAEKSDAEVLFWVGCAASYDDRAKKTARATVALLKAAEVDFAILGDEESCTGDPARRAGNEYLFTMLAEANIEVLNGYKEQGLKKIVTTCPHCFNTLAREYPDFGGHYEVVHHTDFLLGLVAEGRLQPKQRVDARVVYHDSCYLGRYNEIYESPREILRRIPGVDLVEVPGFNRHKGLCCGAGGAQMWMEEQNNNRVNVKRTRQLLSTGAKMIASACPFCMTMVTDGIKAVSTDDQSKEDQVKNLDVVELLAQACGSADGEHNKQVVSEASA